MAEKKGHKRGGTADAGADKTGHARSLSNHALDFEKEDVPKLHSPAEFVQVSLRNLSRSTPCAKYF
jgi:hypothetical protein